MEILFVVDICLLLCFWSFHRYCCHFVTFMSCRVMVTSWYMMSCYLPVCHGIYLYFYWSVMLWHQ